MADDLHLSLPERKKKIPLEQLIGAALLIACLVVGMANLIVLAFGRPAAGGQRELSSAAQKELAMKLEQQQLYSVATAAWQTYLEGSSLSSAERAKLWYRVGTIRQQAEQYEQALAAYYLSEAIQSVPELSSDLGLRVQECLERLGRFAALRQELSSRASTEKDKQQATQETKDAVAEIGPEKITKARLDQLIEQQIELQISPYAAFLTPDQLQKQKDALFKQYASPEQRTKMLNQYIAEEVLYRKAREDKLGDNGATRAQLLDAERKILAQGVLMQELARNIKITDGDVETYYKANLDNFKQPDRVQLSLIYTTDKGKAEKALTIIRSGEAFTAVAKSLSEDKETAAQGGEVSGWINKGDPLPLIGSGPDASAAIFAASNGELVNKVFTAGKGFAILKVRTIEPEKQKSLEEAREEVYRSLRAAKEQEVQNKLLADLKNRYNVVIHSSQLSQQTGEKQDGAKKQ